MLIWVWKGAGRRWLFASVKLCTKSFALGEKAHPQHREELGAGAAVLLHRAQEAWEGPAAGLGWADGNSRKPKRV